MRVWPGRPFPLGATWDGAGVNFSLFAENAEGVSLCLFDGPDATALGRADQDHVLAFLVKPLRQADLEPAIVVAVSRFEQLQALRRETADLRQALEDRKLIERAKGALMRRTGLPEHDAFRRLQRLASDRNRKLVDVARMILTAEDAYRVDA